MIVDSDIASSQVSYKALLGARMGRVTPRSDTELRPRVGVQEFPDRSGVDPVELGLDLRSLYRTLKGEYSVLGRFSRLDTFNAEYGQAAFDDLDPETPEVRDTGIIFVGRTRTTVQVQPEFRYEWTERTAVAGQFRFDKVSYDSDVPGENEGYDSSRLGLALIKQLGPRTALDFGPYVARYESDNTRNKTDSYGATIGLGHVWTETSNMRLALSLERSNVTDFQPARTEQSSNSWGFEFSGHRRNRVGGVRYRIGRFNEPSSLGNRRTIDEVRVEYNRPLSARTIFVGAVRLWRDRGLGTLADTGRDRALVELTLRRALTRSWNLAFGYRYARTDDTVSSVASNHGALISIEYRGLRPAQRNR